MESSAYASADRTLRLIFGVLYWLVWTMVLPHFGNYRLEEKEEVLDDGTSVTVLARVSEKALGSTDHNTGTAGPSVASDQY